MTTKTTTNQATVSPTSTEGTRCEHLEQMDDERGWRIAWEGIYGQVWDTTELKRDFVVLGFLAPVVAVRRKDNGAEGTLDFLHQPRLYFNYRRSRI